MRPELEQLNSRLEAMSREDLILSIRRLMEEFSEKEAILEINSGAATEMAIQFQQIKGENAALKKENKELLRQNRDLTDQLQMRKKDLYGRKSEKSPDLPMLSLMTILWIPLKRLRMSLAVRPRKDQGKTRK